ncbi:MAG: hypothetical protein GKR96_05920 [Gammaproteobacteria bacterium]|nr:hypothetical protein [Gammaproteobacteria bacterium]
MQLRYWLWRSERRERSQTNIAKEINYRPQGTLPADKRYIVWNDNNDSN